MRETGEEETNRRALPWYRKRVDALLRITEEARTRLHAAARVRRLPRRAQVLNAFDGVPTVFWIEDGRVRLSRFEADGSETAVAILERGEVFGLDAEAGPGEVRAATAEALEPSTVLAFDRDAFETLRRDEHLREATQSLLPPDPSTDIGT
jgi:CRP-like cAMP-binding protein